MDGLTAVRPFRLVLVLLVVALAAPAAAWAKSATKVFPLSASKAMPANLEGTPEKLTKTVAAMVGGTIADSSITAAATAIGCTIDDAGCLDQLTRVNRVEELVFGTIRIADDQRVFVKLTRYIAGTERRERTFALTSDTTKQLAKQLARASREMFDLDPDGGKADPPDEDTPEAPRARLKAPKGKSPKDLVREGDGDGKGDEGGDGSRTPTSKKAKSRLALEETDPPPGREGDPPPIDDAPRASGGRVTTGTYALIGGGLVGVSVGTGLVVAAWALSDDINRAPRNTPQDFQLLTQLERAYRQRWQAGGTLLVIGGVATVSGVVRAVLQKRKPAATDRAVSVVPIDRGGGAALVVSGRFW
jgi:hypothetical protein